MALIRDARLEDAQSLLKIYTPYVEKTAITFEYEPPSLAEFESRMERILRRYPYLVLEEAGVPLGYAYAGPFYGRAAYDWSCETTIYLRWHARGHGLGARLYGALEEALRGMGLANLYACVACPLAEDETLTTASERFHRRMGYREVGRFHRCGYKFERWYDVVWMEKLLREHPAKQPPIRPYRDISAGASDSDNPA